MGREGRIDAECALSCSNIHPDNVETSADPTSAFDTELESGALNRDIDLCVHELVKLFGHLGTPEYCHGISTFRIFLAHNAEQGTGSERERVLQVCSEDCLRAPDWKSLLCNAGHLFFLSKAMVNSLNEQRLIKPLNCLESRCWKLQDPVLLANL